MEYRDLRDFIGQLEHGGELKRIAQRVDPNLEITEIADPRAAPGRPGAVVRKSRRKATIPLLANLFGTPHRVALALGRRAGRQRAARYRQTARLSEGAGAAQGIQRCAENAADLQENPRYVAKSGEKATMSGNCLRGDDVDLNRLPIQTCWPGDAGR